jgi:hypothetical protein
LRQNRGPHPRRASPASSRRDERRGRKGDPETYADRFCVMEDRVLREQDLAERMAERNRYAQPKRRFSVRARIARRLFARVAGCKTGLSRAGPNTERGQL